jgi:hypothetical protein
MIFSVDGSIEKIKAGTKKQTRRPTHRYQTRKSYAIQPGRTKPGITDGRIRIWEVDVEFQGEKISKLDARQEGGYTPEKFEELYEKIYPGWKVRYVYRFRFIPSEGGNP